MAARTATWDSFISTLVTLTLNRTPFGSRMPKRKTRITCNAEAKEDYERSASATPESCYSRQATGFPMDYVNAPRAPLVKLPEFWDASPAAWFAHTESQFDLYGVNDDNRRYHHVVAALPASVATRIVGLLSQPPAGDKYAALKFQLLYNFSLSDAERADELFALNGLGARRPSQLMEHMLALLGDHAPGFLFIQLFLRQLPVAVRTALAGVPTGDLRAFAREADKFYIAQRSSGSGPSVFYTSSAPPATGGRDAAARVGRPPREHGLCFYHERFGNKATKCRQPCSFAEQGNAQAGVRL